MYLFGILNHAVKLKKPANGEFADLQSNGLLFIRSKEFDEECGGVFSKDNSIIITDGDIHLGRAKAQTRNSQAGSRIFNSCTGYVSNGSYVASNSNLMLYSLNGNILDELGKLDVEGSIFCGAGILPLEICKETIKFYSNWDNGKFIEIRAAKLNVKDQAYMASAQIKINRTPYYSDSFDVSRYVNAYSRNRTGSRRP